MRTSPDFRWLFGGPFVSLAFLALVVSVVSGDLTCVGGALLPGTLLPGVLPPGALTGQDDTDVIWLARIYRRQVARDQHGEP